MRLASDVQRRALGELAKPASMLLPKPVRDVIVDLLALVAELDRRVFELEQVRREDGEDQGGRG